MHKKKDIIVFEQSKHYAIENHGKGGKAVAISNPVKAGLISGSPNNEITQFKNDVRRAGLQIRSMDVNRVIEAEQTQEAEVEAKVGLSLSTGFEAFMRFIGRRSKKAKVTTTINAKLEEPNDKLQLQQQQADIIEYFPRGREGES